MIKIIFIFMIFAGFSDKVDAAELLYSNSFESGTSSNGWGSLSFSPCGTPGRLPYSYTFKRDNSVQPREGSYSARIENRGGADNNTCPNITDAKHRAQLRIRNGTVEYSLFKRNAPIWMGFSVYVPKNHPTSAGDYILLQVHSNSPGPEFYINMARSADSLSFIRSWSAGPSSPKQTQSMGSTSIEKGVWIDFVIYRERDWANQGVTRIWKNGKQIINRSGEPNAHNYAAHGKANKAFFDVGIYWGIVVRQGVNYVLHFDSIRIAEGTDGYNLVDPSRGSNAQPTPLPSPSPTLAKPKAPANLKVTVNTPPAP